LAIHSMEALIKMLRIHLRWLVIVEEARSTIVSHSCRRERPS
jgi:hypothetical protein